MLAAVPLLVILGQLAVEQQNSCARIQELIAVSFPAAASQKPDATCRAQVAAGRHPEIVSPLVAAATAGNVNYDVFSLLCLLHPPGVTSLLKRGIGIGYCLESLAEEDNAEAKMAVQAFLAKPYETEEHLSFNAYGSDKQLSSAIVEAAAQSRTFALRVAYLLPDLRRGHIDGYDRLREAVCGPTSAPAADAPLVCDGLPPNQETSWQHARLVHRKVAGTALIVGFSAGLTALGWFTRDKSSSQSLAVFTLALGTGVAVDAAVQDSKAGDLPGASPILGILAAIPAGVIGYFATRQSGASRAVVTGIGALGISVGGTFDIW